MLENTTYSLLDGIVRNLPVGWRAIYDNLLYASLNTRMHRLFSRFIQPGDLVLDIGANVGKLTAVFMSLGARVVAVEPQPACVTTLKRRFGTQPQVTIIPGGVAEKVGPCPSTYPQKQTPFPPFRPISSSTVAIPNAFGIRSSRFRSPHWMN